MIAKQNLLNILAAADKADADDIAIREALYIALRGSDENFAGSTEREPLGVHTLGDPRKPLIFRSSLLGKRRSCCRR